MTTNNAIINDDGVKCILKIRVPCESRKVGKSGGFRLIAIANRESKEVVFLEIFPKTGPLGKDNITDREFKKILEEYLEERNEKLLVRLDILNELAEIESPE